MPKTISEPEWRDLLRKASVLKPKSDPWKEAVNKLIEESATPEEAKDVYMTAPVDTRQNGTAYRNWISICEEEYLRINDAEDAMTLFPLTPKGSSTQKRVASKWFELAKDFFYARKLYLVDGISALLRQRADDKQRQFAEEAGMSLAEAICELYSKKSPA